MKKMKIVSACLAGVECRYDCEAKTRDDILEMVKNGEAIPVCPEQLGGLATPRPPAEIQGDKVVDVNDEDITEEYEKGAEEAFKILKLAGAEEALLKSKSPMCGIGQVYDGTFEGNLVEGDGIFARLLRKNGIKLTKVD